MIPRHVLQPDRDLAADGVGHHHVGTRDVRDDLQQGPDVHALERQRNLLARVLRFTQFALVELFLRQRLKLDREQIAGLVCHLLEVAARDRRHADFGVDAEARRVDELHGSCEIEHVETTYQSIGHTRILEFRDDLSAFFDNVDGRSRIGQRHHDASFAFVAPTEIDRRDTRARLLHRRGRRNVGRPGSGRAVQGKKHAIAVDANRVSRQLAQLDNQTRASFRLRSRNRLRSTDIELLVSLGDRKPRIRQIHRQARG